MNGKEIALALKKGEYVYGTAILSPSPVWPRVVESLGLDFVFIDTEHTPLNRETVSSMCQVYSALDLAPLVRIPSPDPLSACMALDGGASGIISPYVETVEQVKALVGAVKFKPIKGEKIKDMNEGTNGLSNELAKYLEEINSDNVLVLNIESVPALNALDEILSIQGIDALLVGPHDMTCSLGIPEQYDHPLFKAAVNTIIKKARKKKVGVGIHAFYPSGFKQEIEWAKQGANLIVHSSDIIAFKTAIQCEMDNIKKSIG